MNYHQDGSICCARAARYFSDVFLPFITGSMDLPHPCVHAHAVFPRCGSLTEQCLPGHVTYTIDSASVSGPHAAAVQLDNLRAPNLDHALRNSDLTSSITSTHEYSPSPTSPVSVHVHAASTYPGVSGGVDMRGLHGQDIISHMDPDAPYDPNGTSVSALTNGRSETGQISSPPPTVSHRQAPVTSTCTVANVVPTNSGQHGTDRIRHGPSTGNGLI